MSDHPVKKLWRRITSTRYHLMLLFLISVFFQLIFLLIRFERALRFAPSSVSVPPHTATNPA